MNILTLSKKATIEALLQQENSIFIQFDATKANVIVPVYLKSNTSLVLQIGYNMMKAIPDLNLDEEGISATLSFSDSPFYCFVPWSSLSVVVTESKEVLAWPVVTGEEQKDKETLKEKSPTKPYLTLVK